MNCGAAYTGGQAGRFRTVIASLPETTSGDIKFVNADTTTTMYTLPATFTPSSVLTEQTTDIVTHVGGTGAADNGLAFLIQDATVNVTSVSATAPAWTIPTARTYRTYSFQQTGWGEVRTVNPISSGASDIVRDDARRTGRYPEVNSDGIVNGLDVNESVDAITAGFATAALASTSLHAVGGATNGRDVAASLKTTHYNGITTTAVVLPYSLSGTEVTFTEDIRFASVALNAAGQTEAEWIADDPANNAGNFVQAYGGQLSGTRTIPCSDLGIDSNETVSSLVAPNFTIIGTPASSSGNKVSLRAADGTITITDATEIENISLRADSIVGATQGKLANITAANGGNNITYISDDTAMTVSFTGLTLNAEYSAEDLLGENYSVTGIVSIVSDVAITLATNDANVIGSAAGTGTGAVTKIAVPNVASFTHDGDVSGGEFALFSRTGDGVAWTLVSQNTYAAANPAGTPEVVTVNNPTGQYLSLWKPANATTYTRQVFTDLTAGITTNTTYTAPTLGIATEVLSGAPVPANTVVWTSGSITDEDGTRVQLIGTISNTDTSGNRLTNIVSQSVMLSALAQKTYFDLLVANVNTTGFIDLTEDRADFIIAASATSTLADGAYLELASGGTQQGMTAIGQSSLTSISGMLSAQIMGKEGSGGTGVDISFAAVDIAVNPDGISAAEVQAALRPNQQVILTAVQRGALKAATYSAGSLEG